MTPVLHTDRPAQETVTVALPAADTPLSVADRLSLRLALWLLLRTERTRRSVVSAPARLLPPVSSDANGALSPENAATLANLRLLRQLR